MRAYVESRNHHFQGSLVSPLALIAPACLYVNVHDPDESVYNVSVGMRF